MLTPLFLLFGLFVIIEAIYFNIGLICLLKVNLLGYRSLQLNSIVQAILYNGMMLDTFMRTRNIGLEILEILFLLLDIVIVYMNIKIFKNKQILKQFFSSKIHKCHNCGIKVRKNWNNCPKCAVLLVERENSIEEVPTQSTKVAQRILKGFVIMNLIFLILYLSIYPVLPTSPIIVIFAGFLLLILIFSIGLIALLKPNLLGYRSLKLNSIVQVIFYNCIMFLWFIFIQGIEFVLLFLLLDIVIIYLNIKIIKNEQIFRQYFSSKCHKCGTKIRKNWKNCPKCAVLLVERENGVEELPIQNTVQKLRSDKISSGLDKIIGKRSKLKGIIFGKKPEAGENMEKFDLKFFKDLSFLNEKKDKKILKKYLLERFVFVSNQTRNEIDKLNLLKEEKIDILKDLAFLMSKEQQDLLELLLHLYNN